MNITYANKTIGSQWTAANANEVKTAVNSKADALANMTTLSGTTPHTWDGTPKYKELTVNTTVNFSPLSGLKSGLLVVKQDGTGGRALYLGTTEVPIASAANAMTVITWVYNDATSTYLFTYDTNVIGNVSGGGGDTTPPAIVSATVAGVNNNRILVVFNETLDTTSQPIPASFTATINGTPRASDGIVWEGNTGFYVNLDGTDQITAGQTVLLSYTKNGVSTQQIKDLAGNTVDSFSNYAVTNNVGGGGVDADAAAYIAAEETIAPISAADEGYIDTLIKASKAGTNWWSKVKAMHLFMGSGRLNAKNPLHQNSAYRLTLVGATVTAGGLVTDGVDDYADTNMPQNVAFATESETHVWYQGQEANAWIDIGVFEAGIGGTMLWSRDSGNFYNRIQSGADNNAGANASAIGLYIATIRTNGATLERRTRKNNSAIFTEDLATGSGAQLSQHTFFLGCRNKDTTPEFYRHCRFGIYIALSAVTDAEMTQINNDVNAFLTSTGRL